MLLEAIQESARAYSANAAKAYGKHQDESSLFPVSWEADSVSISDEARTAQQSAFAGEKKEEDDGAAGAFREYMDKARGTGGSSGSGSVQEKIEALKKKLQQLQNQMSQVAQGKTMPEEAKESRISALQAEMNSVMAQLAELESQSASEQAASV